MAKSRAYREWEKRITAGTMSHAQCRAWCSTVIPTALGEELSKRSTLTTREAVQLRNAIRHSGGMVLERDHAEKGLAWIRKYHAAKFPTWVTESFDRFTFQGDGYNINRVDVRDERSYLRRPFYVPVWRIHGTGGQWLDYCAASWRSGSTGPRIVRRSDDPTSLMMGT